MKNLLIILATFIILGSAGVNAAGNAANGKAKSALCASCHMADGNSVNPIWPNLAGQHENYLAKQLRDFKEGKTRSDPVMGPMVAALTDQDMQDLGAFYAGQAPKGGTANPDSVALGKTLYVSGNAASGVAACSSCHGPNGKGNPAANFPRVAGQHALYAENQLKAFRDGTRSNDAGKMMRMSATKLSDDEIKAVSEYMQGLK